MDYKNSGVLWVAASVLLFVSGPACSDDDIRQPDLPEKSIEIVADPDVTYQTIAGFGGADGIFNAALHLSAGEANQVFDKEGGNLGLSLFRIKIPYEPADWPQLAEVALDAQQYGVKIIASPWSPPPSMKSNQNHIGGSLLVENYQAYTDHLNAFVSFMTDNGVDIHAISIQNEPDIQVSYESCDWTAEEMKEYLKLFGDQIQCPVAVAESFNFNQSFTNEILNDPEAAQHLDIVAGHIYGGGLAAYPLAEQLDKEIWMTEYLLNLNESNWAEADAATKWEETLVMLSSIHEAMVSNWNAYMWWYIKRYYSFIGDGTQGTAEGEIQKRGYAFAQYAKFIRPGYVRIGVEDNSGLDVTAFKEGNKFVFVLLNTTDGPVSNISISVDGLDLKTARSYTTSRLSDLTPQEFNFSDSPKFIVPGKSIMTIILE